MRALGLRPEFVGDELVDVEWKLYELKGKFYAGRPKDGSIRAVDLPPFLAELLASHPGSAGDRTCTCRNSEAPWCRGDSYEFLGPARGHFRRSGYGERFFRPAADGWYPARGQRPAMPVLADASCSFPGRPVAPWPPAIPGETFAIPVGRGIPRLTSDAQSGRCSQCGRAYRRRLDGLLIAHDVNGRRCAGSRQPAAEDTALASWLPVLTGLTPHGLRHGHQTWMEEASISDLLRSERMGHEVPGMRGVYGHVTPAMRDDLKAALQQRWEASLRERAQLSPRSIVPVLDALLTTQREQPTKIGSHLAPRIGHQRGRRLVAAKINGR